ncbi:MAG: hypothetical protein JST85_04675 [Acidobacteria bacterium]|nr:hypothetical protein [Acidobacteriota bacterium]
MQTKQDEGQQMIPCCPPLEADRVCDVLDFHYRQIHNTTVPAGDRRQNVQVEVIIHARLERCPGPLTLGDLVYTTTLLPGEKVKLFTADRRTRFTFDSASKVSYRNEQTSEERSYMASMSDFMSDVSSRDSIRSSNQSKGSAEGHAETSGAIESFFAGPSVDVSGSYSAESSSDFLRELSSHAQASNRRSEIGVRTSNSVSVGEVQSRTHTETESQDHFESASREFANPNRCHAVTFFFYQINKKHTIKFTIESIERRVIDPAADTKVTNNSFASRGGISAVPTAVLATAKDRLEVEAIGRASVTANQRADVAQVANANLSANLAFQPVFAAAVLVPEPLTAAVRQKALQQVDERLVATKLIDRVGGKITDETKTTFSFEQTGSLPTPGIIVKGCFDDCDICEPSLQKEIELELERKQLENELLKRKIELLDKAQEYRCCPADSEPEA